jgi:hypothetical protein
MGYIHIFSGVPLSTLYVKQILYALFVETFVVEILSSCFLLRDFRLM